MLSTTSLVGKESEFVKVGTESKAKTDVEELTRSKGMFQSDRGRIRNKDKFKNHRVDGQVRRGAFFREGATCMFEGFDANTKRRLFTDFLTSNHILIKNLMLHKLLFSNSVENIGIDGFLGVRFLKLGGCLD